MGNQQSLANALEYLGSKVIISSDLDVLKSCDILTWPGVGAFPEGMKRLRELKLDSFIIGWVKSQKPLIGICLGMQMLFESGEEYEFTNGLGLIPGHVSRLDSNTHIQSLLLPHIGWNKLIVNTSLYPDFSPFSDVNQYFVHSYSANLNAEDHVLCTCSYSGIDFVAAVAHGSVIGFQFHPERSGSNGLDMLELLVSTLRKEA